MGEKQAKNYLAADEAFFAVQAGVLPRSQVQCGCAYRPVRLGRNLPQASGERVRRGRRQACAE